MIATYAEKYFRTRDGLKLYYRDYGDAAAPRVPVLCLPGSSTSLRAFEHVAPRLAERRAQKAGLLSGGEQQMLAIGRAIMAHPSLLVLDEPSMGLSPLIVKSLFDLVRTLNEQGVTILLVEQNVRQALQIADHAFVLQTGRVVMQGPGSELLADPAIRKAYIGSVAH